MSGDYNIGFHQSGSGRIDNSGPVAVGSGARATGGPVPPSSEGGLTPEQALAALRELLAEHGAALPDEDRARARGEIEEVAEQLAGPAPDGGRVARAVDRLAAALSSVTVLATGAGALREAVTRILGG